MNEKIKRLVATMTNEELCSEVLCWEFHGDVSRRQMERFIKENSVVNFLYPASIQSELGDFAIETIKKYSKTPPLVTAGNDFGILAPYISECPVSELMALGASGDCDTIFDFGRTIGRMCASVGINLLVNNNVDVNYNFNNPSTNVFTVSDDPERVYKIMSAFSSGMRSEGNVAITVKRFPGEGVDDRSSHFSTTVNSMPMDKWWATYGEIYKRMIKDGTDAVMVGHIALPAYGVEADELGALPSTLSHRVITDLLKGELGFSGCVISDAASMIGISSRISAERLAVEFFKAGGDLLFYPDRGDRQRLLLALRAGEISRGRMIDAVSRVLELKDKLGLFSEKKRKSRDLDADLADFRRLGKRIAEDSITLIRNFDNVLPLDPEKHKRILQINISYGKKNERTNTIPTFTSALENSGCIVDFMTNPTHYRVDNVVDEYDAVIIVCDISPKCCSGTSLRVDWNNVMAFWRGYALRNKKVIFLSLGDPYKLYDLPFLRTYVNAYSTSYSSAEAAVKAIFGRIAFKGKSPVRLEGCFEREDI